ncbi:MAG TPA: hypothetical protein VI636_05960 [Candidatus Angelobacter sp.]
MRLRLRRISFLALAIGVAACISVPLLMWTQADGKPNIQLNADDARPRQLEEVTQNAILRDYTLAWQAMNTALDNNTIAPLKDNFTGFALEKLTQRVKDQQHQGLRTRIIDGGHKVEAIFYSKDGSAVELRDTASIETQVLDGDTVIHSDKSQVQYLAIMTGAADRWQVRVLESAPAQ